MKISLIKWARNKYLRYEYKFLFFKQADIIFIIMKAILNQYRRFYSMPQEMPDHVVMSHLLVLTVFFFTLGFMVSQIIIFLIGK
ncbi:MAG TPA: hypothetical protein VGQ09_17890 [Chitinophagaceae bacterium]|nr:hypothetical protein [Chitinophagaceae bacterium]